MSLITKEPNYDITGGDKLFDPVQMESNTAAVAVEYSDIDTDDVEAYLEQSVDGSNWNEVPDSSVVLDKAVPSHLWNVTIKQGMFIRVGIVQNTAAAGNIDVINILT